MRFAEIRTWSFWHLNLITALIYVLIGLVCNTWTIKNTMAAPLWLPSGIELAMILCYGNRAFLGVFLAEFIVSIFIGDIASLRIWAASIFIGVGAVLQAVLGAKFILHYAQTKNPFLSIRNTFIFIFGVVFLVSLTNCTISSLSLLLFGVINPSKFINNWFFWWLGDVVGLIVGAPLIITWYQTKFTFQLKIFIEFCIWLVLLIITTIIIYSLHRSLVYLLLPFCVWSAVHFSTRLAVFNAFLISLTAIWIEVEGYKQFNIADLSDSLLFLQMFVAVIFFTTLILSAVINERRKAQDELLEANIELESRVEQRTQDLNEKNVQLNKTLEALKQAETQLIHAEKMSSLGVLTAGIAHEINNPVNFISANINPLKNDIQDIMQVFNKYAEITSETAIKDKLDEIAHLSKEIDLPYALQEIHTLIAGIEEGAKRTATIVKDLRTFSRLDEGSLKTANIHENLDSTLTLLQNQFRERIELIKHYSDIPDIECFPGKINQVFMNILTNAIHAISDKGVITITTSINLEQDTITIKIRDSGMGMDKETSTKIFEPFFTTKPVGQGTGLGLSISYSIIQEHHGSIAINSAPGEGSEFIITLPIKYK